MTEISEQEARLFERLKVVAIAALWTIAILAIGVVMGFMSSRSF